MGFKISWMGFRDLPKNRVLEVLRLKDFGLVDEANEFPLSGAPIPGGWYIIWANDFEFVSSKRLRTASAECLIVACQVHEGVMVSTAICYEKGREVWQIVHNAQEGVFDLEVSGAPPDSFEAIRERLTQEQRDEDGQASEVDFIFDVPVETAYSMCGFRHDKWRYDCGEPTFTRLVAM